MIPFRTLLAAGAVVAAAASLVAPVTTAHADAPSTVAVPAAKAAPAKPAVGSCHDMSVKEAYAVADPDPAVSCARRHTSRTIAVPTVPAGIKMTNGRALARIVDQKCSPAYERAIHPSRKQRLLSAYAQFWFAPTKAQIRQGARWIRCDVVLQKGRSLAPLPPAQVPALGNAPHPDREARCYLGRKGGYLVTTCDSGHAYRTVTAYEMQGRRYPSQRKSFNTAKRRCGAAAGKNWTTFNPSREQWRAGYKWYICTRKTTA